MQRSNENQHRSKPNTQPLQKIKCIVVGSSGAGKTSFLRRWKLGTFEPTSYSTISADYYSSLVRIPEVTYTNEDVNGGDETVEERGYGETWQKSDDEEKSAKEDHSIRYLESKGRSRGRKKKKTKKPQKKKKKEERPARMSVANPTHVSLQMWDTAGRERFVSESTGLTSTLGDAFFRNADAAVLVYDATSSRSFLQLMKWHSELLERIRLVNSLNIGMDKLDAYEKSSDYRKESDDWQIPIVVVGTKVDKVRAEVHRNTLKRTVPQRDVMGLKGKAFKGIDSYYEYTVNEHNLPQKSPRKKGSANALSYGLEVASWVTDRKYLHAIQRAEDGCFPDRNMVSLWCHRNGLVHVEISALDGSGIDTAIQSVVSLVLKSKK